MELTADIDPTPFLRVLAVSLILGLFGMRRLRSLGLSEIGPCWSKPKGTRQLWVLLVAITLLASAPVMTAAWVFSTNGAWLPGDSASHAQVAREIANTGLPRGWIESYSSGFPFGPHYQSVPLLLIAGLVWLGFPALGATHAVGILSVLVVPLIFLLVARRTGAAPLAALAGALLLSWVEPAHSFMGGAWPMLSQGLVSQVVAMPLVIAASAAVIGALPSWSTPVLAAAAMASHAQLTPCALLAGGAAVLAAGTGAQRRRLLTACLSAGVSGIALYGPGLLHFALPFSWPPVPAFRVVGYGWERLLEWWLTGRLLDVGHTPILTATLWCMVVVLIFTARSRASRGTLVFVAVTLLVSSAGETLSELGGVSTTVIEVFSPVRMLCLVPVAAAMAICTGITELMPRLRRVAGSTAFKWVVRRHVLEIGLLVLFAIGAGAPSVRHMSSRVTSNDMFRDNNCRSHGFGGFDGVPIVESLRRMTRGRFVVHAASTQTPCPVLGGIELESATPLGEGTAGPGSQLGVMTAAFRALKATVAGSDRRAEALGIRTLLHPRSQPPIPADRWRVIARHRDSVLSERTGGSDLIGIGCVTAMWRGSDRALRDALFVDLASANPQALDPEALVLLERASQPLEQIPIATTPCDPSGATISVLRTEPGHHQAVVTTVTPAELVIRATYIRNWTVTLDGKPASTRLVAPGFVAVHLQAGKHTVTATVAPFAWYRFGLMLAALFVAALAWMDHTRLWWPNSRRQEIDHPDKR